MIAAAAAIAGAVTGAVNPAVIALDNIVFMVCVKFAKRGLGAALATLVATGVDVVAAPFCATGSSVFVECCIGTC